VKPFETGTVIKGDTNNIDLTRLGPNEGNGKGEKGPITARSEMEMDFFFFFFFNDEREP